MDEELLQKSEGRIRSGITRAVFMEEVTRVSSMAVTFAEMALLQYLLQVVSLMMAGHLRELALSGFEPWLIDTYMLHFKQMGYASGLEILCGQAYGAQEYQKVGSYTYCAIISVLPIFLPICLVWIFMDKLLVLIGQDPQIAMVACKYATWLIPAFFGHWLVLLAQCDTARNLHEILIIVRENPYPCPGGRFRQHQGVLLVRDSFYRNGNLPNSKLETSLISVCFTTTSVHFYIPFGISAAASTRVSNELGAENPQAVQLTAVAVMALTVAESVVASTIIFCCCYVFGYAYSNEKEIVDGVIKMVPLLCFSIIMDSYHAVLGEELGGSGAYINAEEENKKEEMRNHDVDDATTVTLDT
ncbi:hypothetical protein F3Y22_tig00116951pilonHSYRG00451 [Hibiscus syriacus]|uniref:MATE efflux family protein n=1 Tax=Hibiscus syriacus TaxID=106335 RepID=A0A6A2WLB8_HIBSY|nr:hypothetical protein F3Y22_tig00116951pilonHSYRG00451 [Hibiscus syriacus]